MDYLPHVSLQEVPSLGSWLCQFRKSRRLTQKDVAARATEKGFPLSHQHVEKIENGHVKDIGIQRIKGLAAGLGIPLYVLQDAIFRNREPVFQLVGRVAAGQAGSANEDEYGEAVPYFEFEVENTELYYVEIMGDSMAPKIAHGDLALIRPFPRNMQKQPNVYSLLQSGHVYLVQDPKRQHNTCKYLVEDFQEKDVYWLLAENQSVFPKTKLTSAFHILGEVIEVRKTLSLSRPILKD